MSGDHDAATAAGSLEAIWLKRVRRGPMDPVSAAELVEDLGLRGNANQGGRRQVTLIDRESWRRMMEELEADLDPSARRANLLVGDISLRESRGRILRVGECGVRIEGETRPCNRMDEAFQGLRDAMATEWRGGAFGVVIEGGTIRVGDPVAWAE